MLCTKLEIPIHILAVQQQVKLLNKKFMPLKSFDTIFHDDGEISLYYNKYCCKDLPFSYMKRGRGRPSNLEKLRRAQEFEN